MKQAHHKFFLRFVPLVAVFLLLLGDCFPVFSDDGISSKPSVSAQSYCLMDARDGSVIASGKEEVSLPIASTTKIMTALVVLNHCSLGESVTVSSAAVGTEGSSMYLQKGEKLSVQDLLYGLMLQSANDAAVALAIHTSGSVEAFADLMNQKAKELGMKNSHFCNPSGLSQEGHSASARDMALLMAHAMKDPVFREITGTKQCRVPSVAKGESRYLSNHNRLLSRYEHCIGGKTGYTTLAGRCLVTVSEKDGVELIAVTLNDGNDWADHIALYEYGFSLYQSYPLCEKEELRLVVPVVGGTRPSVTLSNRERLNAFLRSGEGIEVVYEAPSFLYAPIVTPEADSVNIPLPQGKALLFQNGVKLGELWLYAEEEIPIYDPPSWWERILMFFGFLK